MTLARGLVALGVFLVAVLAVRLFVLGGGGGSRERLIERERERLRRDQERRP